MDLYKYGTIRFFTIVLLALLLPQLAFPQKDLSHFSLVFNREKPFRIFLPDDYETSQKQYPVIYYFHGNTGTHKLSIDGVKELVNAHGIILVAWNGRSVESDLRPYNIGNHSNIIYPVQFRDYFREFVNYIDSTYRTVRDRSGRAVMGHSMGGIMSFFLAEEFPGLISAAFSSKGSPEFFIGTPENHSLYHVRHMFRYLYGVRLGFATALECELYNLNNEVISGALREKNIDFTYKIYEGGHDINPEQFRDGFEFLEESFENPLPEPERWSHSDLYPEFDVRGYEVKSSTPKPGFITLEGVARTGFKTGTKKWEPDGAVNPGVRLTVTTPSYYRKDFVYKLLDYNETDDTLTISEIKSDNEGRITLNTDHKIHQTGIFRKGDPAEITIASSAVNGGSRFLDHKKPCRLAVRLLNRGGSSSGKLRILLETSDKHVKIDNPVIEAGKLGSAELKWLPSEFIVTASGEPVSDGSPFRIKFFLTVTDDKNYTWKDEFELPVFYDVPEFTSIGIDDGDSGIFGSGNGSNSADPGETLMIYEISNGSKRLRLYYDDPYVDSEKLYDEIQPDKWGDGYSLSSLIHISENCPEGHKIRFLASYEIKDWRKIKREVTWGTFTIVTGGK